MSRRPRRVHVVVPDGVDDPARPSGGNTYDRRLCDGLRELGWQVTEHQVPGAWPEPDAVALSALAGMLARLPDGAIVVVDGLVASPSPGPLVPEARRLRLVLLVHLPLMATDVGDEVADAEAAVLASAAAIITTSAWTKDLLVQHFSLSVDEVHVAEPGVVAADEALCSESGGQLLCVAAVTPLKGHDVLARALAHVADLSWQCRFVGPVDRDPAFTAGLADLIHAAGLEHRITFTGPLTGEALGNAYAATDLLVAPSRTETFGLVVTEALARGIPVLTTTAGGLPGAFGSTPDGTRPGLLVPPGNPAVLGAALRDWLRDARLRLRLREAARERRRALRTWGDTASDVAGVLEGLPVG